MPESDGLSCNTVVGLRMCGPNKKRHDFQFPGTGGYIKVTKRAFSENRLSRGNFRFFGNYVHLKRSTAVAAANCAFWYLFRNRFVKNAVSMWAL